MTAVDVFASSEEIKDRIRFKLRQERNLLKKPERNLFDHYLIMAFSDDEAPILLQIEEKLDGIFEERRDKAQEDIKRQQERRRSQHTKRTWG